MKTPNYEETRLQPLTTDALLEARVADLIGRAIKRQLWFLFLDDGQVQLPLIIPVDDLPVLPDAHLDTIARQMSAAMDAAGARSVVIVIERYAESALTDADRAWARSLHDAFEQGRVTVRGILLSHRRGVRWVAQDDYRF